MMKHRAIYRHAISPIIAFAVKTTSLIMISSLRWKTATFTGQSFNIIPS